MKRISQIDRIKSNGGSNTYVDNKLEYSEPYFLADFSENELPPLSVVAEMIAESVPAVVSAEVIPFTAMGGYSIDFTINNRNTLYNNPTIYAYIVDGNTETKIQGMSEIINRSAGVIQSVDLDGLFGTGYILIKQ